jgi:hypothetical protein
MPDGVVSLDLRGDEMERGRIKLKGNGQNLTMFNLPQDGVPPPVLVQMNNSDGQCWLAQYSAATRNNIGQFPARSDPP